MQIDIKYEIRSDLTLRAKIADFLFLFGGAILLIDYFILMPVCNFTLEYQLLIFHMLPDYLFSPFTLGIILLIIGLLFRMNSWRKGKILLTKDSLVILGRFQTTLPYQAILSVNRMSGMANSLAPTLKLNTQHEQIQIKISEQQTLARFTEELEKNIRNKP